MTLKDFHEAIRVDKLRRIQASHDEAVASSAVVGLWVCRNCGWRDNYERLFTSQSGLKMACPVCNNWAEPIKPNDQTEARP